MYTFIIIYFVFSLIIVRAPEATHLAPCLELKPIVFYCLYWTHITILSSGRLYLVFIKTVGSKQLI